MDSIRAAHMGMYGARPKPAAAAAPRFIECPELESLWWCDECHEGRFVVGVVENRNEADPFLERKRAGVHWPRVGV